jgi:hypothetical protein
MEVTANKRQLTLSLNGTKTADVNNADKVTSAAVG